MFSKKDPLPLILGAIVILIIDAIIAYMSLGKGFLAFINSFAAEFILYMIIYPVLFLLCGFSAAGLFWCLIRLLYKAPSRLNPSNRNLDSIT
jgi:hypothetical protein